MSSENREIKKRIYIAADVELASPLSISNGTSELTDADVLRNAGGNVFIPGTSIAGAFRGYLKRDKKEPCLFGYSEGNFGEMSSAFVSDAYFEEENVVNRDGVELEPQKTVKNKFDYEVVETGAKTTIHIEIVIREKQKSMELGVGDIKDRKTEEELCFEEIRKLLWALHTGDIRFGAKRNRGCGWIKVQSVYKAEFTKDDREGWISFCRENKQRKNSYWKEWKNWADWKADNAQMPESDYVSITVPLKLTGGISIRRYSAKPNEVDYEQITVKSIGQGNKPVPVVPGTSWAGAVRSCTRSILTQLHAKDVDSKIREWFGYVDVEKEKNLQQKEEARACQSMIIFGESMIEGAVELPVKRNKINRFDASTVDGALYSEKSYFGGTTEFKMKIRKTEDDRYKALIGMMYLVMEEIQEGFLPVGGQAAVGRGIFEKNGEMDISGNVNKEECLSILAQCL